MNDLDRLLAIEELRFLKARYFRLLDTKRWDEWAELFEPDIVADFRDEHPEALYQGREAFVSSIRASLGPALTLHQGHTPELQILDATNASGIWTMQDWLYWPEGGNQVLLTGMRSLLGWGHYHESYRKSSGHWRIASLKLTRMHKVVS